MEANFPIKLISEITFNFTGNISFSKESKDLANIICLIDVKFKLSVANASIRIKLLKVRAYLF